jgi:lipoprotein signal peptidase
MAHALWVNGFKMWLMGVHIVAIFASLLAFAAPAAASRTDAVPCPVEILEVRLGNQIDRSVTETVRDHCSRFVRDCSFLVDPAWVASAG